MSRTRLLCQIKWCHHVLSSYLQKISLKEKNLFFTDCLCFYFGDHEISREMKAAKVGKRHIRSKLNNGKQG